ncbi:MAG: CARDB domain-containing protein [Caldilineaceae bacterium]
MLRLPILLSTLFALIGLFFIQPLHAEENAAPDLLIESLTVNPPSPTAGSSVDVTVVVKNGGDAAAGGFRVHLYVEPADNPPTTSTPPTAQQFYGLGLPAGGTVSFTFEQRPVSSNAPKFYIWIDRDNQVAESNEGNNLAVYPQVITPDAYEEDDSCDTARVIATDGTEQMHNLARTPGSDADWVKFAGIAGVEHVVQAIAIGADADLSLELYASCGISGTFGSGGIITFTAPADSTYYLKVAHNQSTYGPNTDYKLKVTAKGGCAGFFEPNNLCSQAGELTVGGAAQTHTICQAGDIDWTRFEVIAGSTYKIAATNQGANANVQMSLFPSCDSNTSTSTGQQIQFTAPAGGFVYLKTEHLNPNLSGPDTNYTVKVDAIGQPGCQEDSFEQDDNPASAKNFVVNDSLQTHTTCPAADIDWVKFDAVAGTNYVLETLNLAEKADTVLCLHDPNGTQLLCDDDSGAGYGSRLAWQATTSGTYYVKVRDYDSQVAGSTTQYDLRIANTFCAGDSFESDNAQDEAKAITPGAASQNHNICPAGDADWFAFNAGAGDYTLETAAVGAEADTIIELYDVTGKKLAQNDDYTPGVASRLVQKLPSAGVYYAKVRLFNAANYGSGTEYNFQVKQGAVATVTPTPSPTPSPTPTPTPNQQSGVRTLILVQRAKLAELYGESGATSVLDKLNQLAKQSDVRGEIIRLDNNASVNAAYAAWAANLKSVEKANEVAVAIRQVVMTYLEQHQGVEYVVLVGEDRVLPQRRVRDNTPQHTEKTYTDVSDNNPIGAAVRADYFLTDDYYVDRLPTPYKGREIYIPDLAVGRLVETPAQITGLIDQFLSNPVLDNPKTLVTGYDFVQDTGQGNCEDLQADFGAANVDCSLIGNNWAVQDYRNRQLTANPPFKLQSINGHAAHYAEGAPGSSTIFGTDIAGSSSDLAGGLIYTLGCHSGLNVPSSNAVNPLDLPEAFASKRASYVGNSGYGWGLRGAIGLSEKLMRLYTAELLKGSSSSMGKALVNAKTQYFQQDTNLSGYDEKVMQEIIFYGLPMFQLKTGAALGNTGNEFPGVVLTGTVPTGSLGETISTTVNINFSGALGSDEYLPLISTGDGQYYSLNGSTTADVGAPIQPLFFSDVSTANNVARSVVLRGANYQSRQNFNPVVASPYNEYVTDASEAQLDASSGWYPAIPVALQVHEESANLTTQLGQYNPANQTLRLLEDVDVDIYYSTDTDQTGPSITVVDGVYTPDGKVSVKVGAVDPSGLKEVVLSYIVDSNQSTGAIKTLNMQFDVGSQKWVGSFNGGQNCATLSKLSMRRAI